MIELKELRFAYSKEAEALIGITTAFHPGVTLLLGENGAGKTTLLRIMAGMLFPSEGNCLLDNDNVSERLPSVMRRIMMVGDHIEFPAKTINEMVRIHAQFYPRFDLGMLRKNLSAFGLRGSDRIDRMSLGMRKKAFLSYALSLQTDVLLLDEPSNGLDINSKQTLAQILATELSPEQIVIVSTHSVHDLEAIFDNVAIISRGELLLNLCADKIEENLLFVRSLGDIPGALYSEWIQGVCLGILPADADTEIMPTKTDFALLYKALMKDPFILDYLK